MPEVGRLEGKVALITGGAKGQGAVEARLFIQEGATVFATDVLENEGRALAQETGATFMTHDVASETDWNTVVGAVMAAHDHIDVLVNNAGIFNIARMTETTLQDYERVIAVNQTGVFLGMKAVASHMSAAGRGSIINISSLAGMEGSA
ncbi:MAG: SDR family NAD(P)-dependent oxidoreductase, partial [Gammaproteobacteria bacterium]|nr:SDR family NAD(P)-dependent oxidoreductase [Gammaproteobacteria bacterium]